MNAVEFVKKHGWEKAVEVIKNRPPMNSARYRPSDNKYSSTLSSGKAVCTVQLKRLVESWELVIVWRMPESWRDAYDGDVLGLEGARMYLEMFGNHELTGEELERFKQAIADVESVGGGV